MFQNTDLEKNQCCLRFLRFATVNIAIIIIQLKLFFLSPFVAETKSLFFLCSQLYFAYLTSDHIIGITIIE